MTVADHTSPSAARERAVEAALARLDLDARARLLQGQDTWTLPAMPEIGLRSLVMSDGPIGVRGRDWTASDPAIALPSPTALGATWDPELARRAGGLLAQEARRKGVHVLLGPTLNLHRSPLAGRHFECYSEDPLLTGELAAGYVAGLQAGGVAATPKHFVANDSETERFTVDVRVDERTLRELYLLPFEMVVERAAPWCLMSAYNSVNGSTMTEHAALQRGVLKGEWGFDGAVVSDWLAARNGVRAANGGLDVAMPGWWPVFGEPLAGAVREGRVPEEVVAGMARRVLRLAARTGALAGAPPPVAPSDLPAPIDGPALAREIAARSFVLLANDGVLPLDAGRTRRIAVIGAPAEDPTAIGGGSAEVMPARIVSPLDGLRAALPPGVALTYAPGPTPRARMRPARAGFSLRAVARAANGGVLSEEPLIEGAVRWMGEPPAGVDAGKLRGVAIAGTFTPAVAGRHRFAVTGVGAFRLAVADHVVHEGVNEADDDGGPGAAFLNPPSRVVEVELAAGAPVSVELTHAVEPGTPGAPFFLSCALGHAAPAPPAGVLIERAAAAAAEADVAVVVVATTEEDESEGRDRRTLALPGRQDELVARVAAANPRTVVVVNAGSPVELPWADRVAAVLLTWFPGQEGGAALADVLLGLAEPGGRLPTTWPARQADSPVLEVVPTDGALRYDEGVHTGYRAWERAGAAPAYWFGHGLGYATWAYESASLAPAGDDLLATLRVRLRNTGTRPGREVVQVYLAPAEPDPERPAHWLAGFASVEAAPGDTVEATIAIPQRAAETWDGGWRLRPGPYVLEAGRSVADRRLATTLHVKS